MPASTKESPAFRLFDGMNEEVFRCLRRVRIFAENVPQPIMDALVNKRVPDNCNVFIQTDCKLLGNRLEISDIPQEEYSEYIPEVYVCFSLQEQLPPTPTCRQLTVSYLSETMAPLLEDVDHIAKIMGFKRPLDKCIVKTERFSGTLVRVLVVEPIDVGFEFDPVMVSIC